MPEKFEVKFMKRCLELAVKAEGLTYPNPMVGSVIVYNGKIIGEGYHLKAGGPHAEVNAINSVHNKEMLSKSTLYVNLEPCSHTGKTPPCADLIISYKIPKVVIGAVDTSDKVSGKGIARLKNAGCEVIIGVFEKESRYLNRRFFTFHKKRRPYITLKWAQSADGYLDIIRSPVNNSGPTWISGKPEKILVHKWRSDEQSILIGAETLRTDNPKLNVREWYGNNPLRLILSSSGMVGKELSLYGTNDADIVFTHNTKADIGTATKVILKKNETSALQIADYLYNSGVQSMLIEGGAQVLNHFISMGLWDEARIFYGNTCFNEGIKAPEISGKIYSKTTFILSRLEMIYNEE